MSLLGESDDYENAKERWESDRTGQKMVHRNEDDDDRVGWSRNRYSFGLLPE